MHIELDGTMTVGDEQIELSYSPETPGWILVSEYDECDGVWNGLGQVLVADIADMVAAILRAELDTDFLP